MSVKRIRAIKHECDACGKVQITEKPSDEVLGLGGRVWEATSTGGCAADWFACSRPCVTVAIGKALQKSWED